MKIKDLFMKINFEKILIIIILLVSLCVIIWFGYESKATEMGLMIVAGAVFLSFLNIDKFKSFKGAGFSAELKDTLDEANATKKELEELNFEIDKKLKKLKEELDKTNALAIIGL